MTSIHKFISIILLIPMCFFLFTIGQIPLMEGYNVFFPYIDTKFGEGYTPEKFDKIKLNDSKEHVLSTLGNPLFIFKDTINNLPIRSYHYTNDGYFMNSNGQTNFVNDFAWYRSNLTINNKNKVIYIDYGWSYD